MKWLDRYLQLWRISQAARFVIDNARLLDVGCFDDRLLRYLEPRIGPSVGIDPLVQTRVEGNLTFVQGQFPGLQSQQFETGSFDCITILAVLEHIRGTEAVAAECFRLLRGSGRVIITVPDRKVDYLLSVLVRLKLIKGMSLEEHHGYEVKKTEPIFTQQGFKLLVHRRFQMGLNNLFVFEKRQP